MQVNAVCVIVLKFIRYFIILRALLHEYKDTNKYRSKNLPKVAHFAANLGHMGN